MTARITLEIITKLLGGQLDRDERELEKRLGGAGQRAGDNFQAQYARAIEKGGPNVERALNKFADAAIKQTTAERDRTAALERGAEATRRASDLTAELEQRRNSHIKAAQQEARIEREITQARQEAARADRDVSRASNDVDREYRRRTESLNALTRAMRDHNTESNRSSRRGGVLGGSVDLLPFTAGGRVPTGAALAMSPILANVASAAVTASQSLALLPAAATAAGAAFLTLKIGVSGFDDAIKNMGDPKKFAEALQGLAPAAQQAALEIKSLVDGPLGDLKKATQETLFAGVAPQLHNLANQLTPTIQQLTTGISGAFNQMFMGATNQLMQPETMKSLQDIINNIVRSFQNLAPAVGPFVDALTRIVQVGSSFLPDFGKSIADAATKFDNFIRNAQQSGKLHEFIQKGIDAAKELGSVIVEIGKKIFEIFGNKDASALKEQLSAVVGVVGDILRAFEGLGQAVNGIMDDIRPIADAIGGWKNLIEVAATGFIAFKLAGLAAAGELATGFAAKGAEAGTGFAKGIAGGLRAFGWAALAAEIAYKIAKPIDDKITEIEARAGIKNESLWDRITNWDWSPTVTPPGQAPSGPAAQQQWDSRSVLDQVFPGARPPGSVGAPSAAPPGPPTGSPLDVLFGPAQPGGPLQGPPIQTPGIGTPGDSLGQILGSLGPPAPPGPAPGAPPTLGLDPWAPQPVPDVPGKTPSQKDRRAAIYDSLNPNDFAVDPFAPFPGMQPGGPGTPGAMPPGANPSVIAPGAPGALPPLEYGTNGKPYAKPGWGYQSTDPQQLLDDQHTLQRDGWELQKAQMDLEVLKRDNLATQEERTTAEQKVIEEGWKLQKDQAQFAKDQQGKWNKVGSSGSLGQLGPDLAGDFGLSEGLPGLVKYLIEALGTMAAAPLLGQLAAISQASPIQGGYGLFGMLGAQNLSNGLSPILGNPLGSPMGSPYGASPLGAPGAYNLGSDYGAKSGNPTVPPPDENQMRSIIQASFGIPNTFGTGSWENASHEYDGGWHHRGLGGATVASGYAMDFHGSSQQMDTLANWIAQNAAGQTLELIHSGPGFNTGNDIKNGRFGDVYGPAMDAEHADHVHWATTLQPQMLAQMLSSMGANPGAMGPSGPGGQSLPVPLPVMVQNGQNLMAPVASAMQNWSADWNTIAQRESGGNWQANTGNGFSGGLQFKPSSWAAAGGTQYAPAAYQASPYQQALTAENLLRQQGPGAWPKTWAPGSSGPAPDSPGGMPGGPLMPGPGQGITAGPGMPGVAGTGSPFPGQQGSSGYQPTPTGYDPGQSGFQPTGNGPGGIGIGGNAMDAAMGAAGAMDLLAPGAGQAAQTGMKLINRTIQYAGQLGAIGAEGLMQTFSLGDTSLGDLSKSWPGKLLAGFAGARPAAPSSAGKQEGDSKQQDPNKQQGQQQNGTNVHIENFHQSPDRQNVNQTANDLGAASQQAWQPRG